MSHTDAHSDAQLRLANVCHPSLRDGFLRHRSMFEVARATNNTIWMDRLRRMVPPRVDGHGLAMEMLDEYERSDAHPPAPRTGWPNANRKQLLTTCGFCLVAVGLVVFLTLGLSSRKAI